MCVVSFVPADRGVYLTSNRDEREGRAPARFPYREGSLLYPRDGAAGGSWIALSRHGDAAVLLNGAYVKHAAGGSYRRSRGLMLLEIARAARPLAAFDAAVLDGVEPFTLVLYGAEGLYECRWDGRVRHRVQLAADRAHVWSSATLYEPAVAAERERRFAVWEEGLAEPDRREGGSRERKEGGSRERILDFHRGEVLTGGRVRTVSITSVFVGASGSDMRYFDLLAAGVDPGVGSDAAAARTAIRERLVRWWIRLRSWEYWPFGIVYAAPIVYWIWLSAKARSWFFFSPANPGIENAGFLMESKSSIYASMPEGSYPRTVYCRKGVDARTHIAAAEAAGLSFPLIAKPDIGQRGMGVSLLHNVCELYVYNARSRVDYLLQEYIDHPHEVGIFYYRMPGAESGHISGIVGKEMLRVKGDGVSTVEELLRREDRFVLQLSALRALYGGMLKDVPAAGEDRLLVPFGNHSRGARFLDWSDRINPALERAIDGLCRQIPGFYFGRLDIRFRSWEALYEGRNFSVIELNGAGSEPTHIYDPRHSIFFAWKEIFRHLRLLYDISRVNARREGLKPMGFRAGWKMLRDYSKHEKLLS